MLTHITSLSIHTPIPLIIYSSYDLTTFTWESTTNADAATPTTVVTAFRLYDQFTATAVMFEITFPQGASGTNCTVPLPLPASASASASASAPPPPPATPATSTAFPSWSPRKGKLPTLGSLSWSKTFLEGLSEGVGAPEPQADNESPTVLFKAHTGTTAVISPVNHFMTMSQASTASAWHYGVGSEVTSLPTGFVFQTLFYASGAGITAGVDAWGGAMKAVHNFTAKMPDTTLTQLGYMTDRGGYYYWYANPPDLHKSSQVGLPERKFKELAAHFHSVSLPVKYYQLDAYWYACDGWNACIEDFAPHPGYFPNGLAALSKALGAPLNLYHNYFCPKNNYTALGFDFVSGGEFVQVVPWQSEAFYTRLMQQGTHHYPTGISITREDPDGVVPQSSRNGGVHATPTLHQCPPLLGFGSKSYLWYLCSRAVYSDDVTLSQGKRRG